MKIKTFKVKDFKCFSENVNNFMEGKNVTKMDFIEKDNEQLLVIAYEEPKPMKDVHIATFHGDRRHYDFDINEAVKNFIHAKDAVDVQFSSGDGDDHFMIMYRDKHNKQY